MDDLYQDDQLTDDTAKEEEGLEDELSAGDAELAEDDTESAEDIAEEEADEDEEDGEDE